MKSVGGITSDPLAVSQIHSLLTRSVFGDRPSNPILIDTGGQRDQLGESAAQVCFFSPCSRPRFSSRDVSLKCEPSISNRSVRSVTGAKTFREVG